MHYFNNLFIVITTTSTIILTRMLFHALLLMGEQQFFPLQTLEVSTTFVQKLPLSLLCKKPILSLMGGVWGEWTIRYPVLAPVFQNG